MTSPTTERRRGLLGSTGFKAPVTVLAFGNVTQYGQQTIDGKALLAVNADGVPDRVACVGQTDATQNGIWDVSTGAWTRSLDANQNYDFKKGTTVIITDGDTYAGQYWNVTAAAPITLGTTLMTWARALASSISTLFFLQSGTAAVQRGAQDKMREEFSVFDFMTPAQQADVVAGTALLNVMPAWKTAIQTNGAGKRVKIPAGTHLFTLAALADIIKVPSGCEIVFEQGAKIKFASNAAPLFAFINCTYSSLKGARFEYTGATPTADVFTRVNLAATLGYVEAAGTWGGGYEVCSVILGVGAQYCEWSDIHIASTTSDKDHAVAFLLNIKEDGTALTHCVGNVIRKVHATECIFTVLMTGQKDCVVDDLRVDRRTGNSYVAPGHVLYTSGVAARPNTNISISNVFDGATFLGWPTILNYALATFALKNLTLSSVRDVLSYNPEGLVQSVADCSKSTFANLCWINEDTEAVSASNTINFVDGNNTPSNFDLHFDNVTVIARNNMRLLAGNSGTAAKQVRISFTNCYVETDLNFYAGQPSGVGVVDWRGADCTFRDIVVRPTAVIAGSANFLAALRTAAQNTFVHGRVVGRFAVTSVVRVPIDAGSAGNVIDVGAGTSLMADDYLNQEAFTSVAGLTSEYRMPPPALRTWRTVAANTDRSLASTLPSRGCFIVFADVTSADRAHGQSGVFLVTFTGQAATLNNVQQLGATITRGADVSALAVTVSTAGVVTIAWTSGVNSFYSVNLGYLKLGSFLT